MLSAEFFLTVSAMAIQKHVNKYEGRTARWSRGRVPDCQSISTGSIPSLSVYFLKGYLDTVSEINKMLHYIRISTLYPIDGSCRMPISDETGKLHHFT